MIATFAIEIILALFALWRYKLRPITRLVVAALSFLALFQLSEYFVCGGIGVDAMQWSRIGYAAITVLPPLGLHILFVLARRKERGLVWTAYGTAALFIGYFLLHPQAFTGHECTGNYAIFQLTGMATALYSAYYYGWLIAAIVLGWRLRRSKDKAQRNAITWLLTGYGVFLIPTSITAIIQPETTAGIPSIMCGFAVIFAILLVMYVLPNAKAPKRAG